jgi:hypothetical protein
MKGHILHGRFMRLVLGCQTQIDENLDRSFSSVDSSNFFTSQVCVASESPGNEAFGFTMGSGDRSMSSLSLSLS